MVGQMKTQADRWRDKQASRWTNVQTDKKTDTERERQVAYKQILNTKFETETDKRTDGKIGRQAD
jgi:hypothetical protein